MATDSDPPTSDRPHSTSQLRAAVKNTTAELEALTNEHGPLYALVHQVRQSNELARSNQRRLAWLLLSILVCLLCLGAFVYFASVLVVDMKSVQSRQTEALDYAEQLVEFAEATDKKVAQAQRQLDDAPKIVSNKQTGQLMVVARIESEEGDGGVTPKKEMLMSSSKSSAEGNQLSRANGLLDPTLEQETRSIEIPIQVEGAKFK